MIPSVSWRRLDVVVVAFAFPPSRSNPTQPRVNSTTSYYAFVGGSTHNGGGSFAGISSFEASDEYWFYSEDLTRWSHVKVASSGAKFRSYPGGSSVMPLVGTADDKNIILIGGCSSATPSQCESTTTWPTSASSRVVKCGGARWGELGMGWDGMGRERGGGGRTGRGGGKKGGGREKERKKDLRAGQSTK